MNSGKTVFSQIMDYLPMYEFRKCVNQYNGNFHTSSFTCMDQFLCMAFAQLTYRESLRDQLFANFDYKICADFKEPLYNQLNLFDY